MTSPYRPMGGYQVPQNIPTPPQTFQEPEEEEFTLRDYYEICLRYRYSILVVTLITFLLSIVIHFILPKKFKAQTLIIRSDQVSDSSNPLFRAFGSQNQSYELDTLKQIVFSNDALAHAIDLIKNQFEKDKKEQLPISKEERLLAQQLLPNTIKEVTSIQKHLNSEDILNISVSLDNAPFLTSAIANGVSESLILSLMERKKQRYRSQVNNLLGTIEKNKEDIRNTEAKLRALLKPIEGITLDQNREKTSRQFETIEQQLNQALLKEQELSDTILMIKTDLDIVEIPFEKIKWINKSSPLYHKLQNLKFQREELLTRYREANPSVTKIDNQISSLRETLIPSTDDGYIYVEVDSINLANVSKLTQLDAEKHANANKITFLNAELGRLSQLLLEAPEGQDKSKELKGSLEMMEVVHLDLHKSLYNTRVQLLSINHDFQIIQSARPNLNSTSPGLVKFSIMGLVLGLGLGLGIAFLINNFENTLKSTTDLKKNFKYPALGAIPKWHEQNKYIDEMVPDSDIAEVYGILRNNVRFSNFINPEKCLLVASAVQHEGKSLTATNLALSFALEGSNTLLISVDLRRPFSHTRFRRPNDFKRNMGIVEYLEDKASLEDVTFESHFQNLSFIPTCSRASNPTKLLRAPRFKDMLKYGENNYDVVILDSPAILPVVDTTLITPFVKGILLVTQANHTPINTIQDSLHRLEHVGSPILGMTLNMIKDLKLEIFYGYGYSQGSKYDA